MPQSYRLRGWLPSKSCVEDGNLKLKLINFPVRSRPRAQISVDPEISEGWDLLVSF